MTEGKEIFIPSIEVGDILWAWRITFPTWLDRHVLFRVDKLYHFADSVPNFHLAQGYCGTSILSGESTDDMDAVDMFNISAFNRRKGTLQRNLNDDRFSGMRFVQEIYNALHYYQRTVTVENIRQTEWYLDEGTLIDRLKNINNKLKLIPSADRSLIQKYLNQ